MNYTTPHQAAPLSHIWITTIDSQTIAPPQPCLPMTHSPPTARVILIKHNQIMELHCSELSKGPQINTDLAYEANGV